MSTNDRPTILQGAGVSKNFGGVRALHDFNFMLYEGEILGLIGPNGSGKTTLFNVISGIYPVSAGQISFWNQRIDGLPAFKISQLGLRRTFQNVRLFPRLTVLTNAKVGAHNVVKTGLLNALLRTPTNGRLEAEAAERAKHWLAFVGLGHRTEELARELPYGEQKLLELARALAGSPKVLLLDEPAAGLNSQETAVLAAVIRRIPESGVTVFVVEHNMRLIMEICDRIMVANFGEKLAEGTPRDIQGNPVVQKAYLGT